MSRGLQDSAPSHLAQSRSACVADKNLPNAGPLSPPDPLAQDTKTPERYWRSLAHLIAGRPRMRVVVPETGKYDRSADLTKRPPALPAAVYIYDVTGRTRNLVLDFDTKHHTAEQVAADSARALSWIQECGGVAVTDISTTAGRHVYIPFASGEAFTLKHLEPLLRLLAARLPSLDLSPMMHPVHGCITVPGSACKDGGYRALDGTVEAAVCAFETRSQPRLIARLIALLGATDEPPAAPTRPETVEVDRWEGTAAAARLRPEWCLQSPLPPAVLEYATEGRLPSDGRWRTHSEARQSVLTAAALRGMSLDDVQHRMRHEWVGFSAAYHRYGGHAETSLTRDWGKARRWTSEHAPFFQSPGHKSKHTGGDRSVGFESPLVRWLAIAYAWIDTEYSAGPERRELLRAVLQALAWGAHITGGDSTVGMGVRGLSLAAGLMPRTTVADVLRDLRERPGSPILRIREASGLLPDRYALVTAKIDGTLVTPIPLDRVSVSPVHDAWRVVGVRARRLYDLVVFGLSRPEDLFAAAGVGKSTGYALLNDLQIRGLVKVARGRVDLGDLTLDDVAAAHGLGQLRQDTIVQYRQDRVDWVAWLELAYAAARTEDRGSDGETSVAAWEEPADDEAMWRSLLADGPPAEPMTDIGESGDDHIIEDDEDAAALALLVGAFDAVVVA